MNKYLARAYHLGRRGSAFRKYFETCRTGQQPPRLHVGCGNRPIAGWCNIDVSHLGETVHFVDAYRRFPFEDESFQFVFSEHFIEHLPYAEALKFFREAHRVLRRGGVLRTATPDLDFLCELRHADSDAKRRYLEYVAAHIAPGQPKSYVACANAAFFGWGHRFIWNPSFMQEVLRGLGFGDFRVLKPGQSAIAELRGLEQHGKSVPAEINELETFVLEATRQ